MRLVRFDDTTNDCETWVNPEQVTGVARLENQADNDPFNYIFLTSGLAVRTTDEPRVVVAKLTGVLRLPGECE
jgi:hypothetical protein